MSDSFYIFDLYLTYPGQPGPLFKNVNLKFQRGWTGIVGKNGSGKSSLAKLISGDILPDRGKILPSFSTRILQQINDMEPTELLEFLFSDSKIIGKWKSLLGIKMTDSEEYRLLSFGEKRRIQFANEISKESEVLILDEPTNHMDLTGIQFIKDAMRHYHGIGILISHDISLLNEFCESIVFIEEGKVLQIPGNFDKAIQEKDRLEMEVRVEHKNLEREKRRLLKSFLLKKNEAMLADKKRSNKNINPKDHDLRAKKQLARLTGKDGTAGKLQNQLKSRLRDVDERQSSLVLIDQKREEYIIPWHIHSNFCKVMFALDKNDFFITNHSKMGIIGKNGSGKTFFIQQIVQKLTQSQVKFYYLPQEFSAEETQNILNRFQNLNSTKRAKVLATVNGLGSDPISILNSSCLSPGEWKKMHLALSGEKKFDILLLDEPTNHLDIYANKSLLRSLLSFSGGVVLATHDLGFMNLIAKEVWELENFSAYKKHLDKKPSLNLELF
ncbi:MAG: ATP-binding cassette domain-containing protein [Leptospira sp.]|nr:ATP-binding cassette domain-containing protein [Leptospira sp.]